MAGGKITRTVGGVNSIECESWTVYTNEFKAYAEQGSYFTADGGTNIGEPKEAPPAGKYFKKGWWSSDYEGSKTITKAKVGDTVYFQVELTEKFPETDLSAEKQKTISFKLYEFDGNEYNISYIYFFGPRVTLDREPKKKEDQKISYVTWEDINKNNKLDPEEEYSKKPYTEVEAKGNRAVMSFRLSEGLSKYFNKSAELKLFMSVSYDDETVDLPEDEDAYLDVELYCCDAKCREPWNDLVKFDPRTIPAVSNYIKDKYDNSIFHGTKVYWAILPITDAYGDKLNMDYYSVKIKKMPSIRPVDYNQPWILQDKKLWTSDILFEHIRKNLGYFLNQDIANLYADSARDQNVWDSTNPITAVMVFDVSVLGPVFDDAAVICTSFKPHQSWIFSPIQNPKNQQHPVSGNRQFGIKQIGDEYEFYVRGADRLTGYFDSLGEKMAFAGADALWKSFQVKLINFINVNGGSSEIDEDKYVWKRCNWIAK